MARLCFGGSGELETLNPKNANDLLPFFFVLHSIFSMERGIMIFILHVQNFSYSKLV